MEEPRVKASIWISAQIRRCSQMALPAVVRRRGDPDAGSILIRLDRLDGFSILKQIRADPRLKALRVIVLTAKGQAQDRRTAEEIGAA